MATLMNDEIFFACESIRMFIFVGFGKQRETLHCVSEISQGSKIYAWIHTHRWTELFKDETWLYLLESAVNLNILSNGKITTALECIADNFPEETKACIIKEMLV